MKKRLLSFVVLCLTIMSTTAQIRITEVDPMANTVKIKNFGMMMTNVSSFVLCDNSGKYPTVMSMNSPMNLMGNQEVTLNVAMSSISMNVMSGNIALYNTSANFMMPANMMDFFQWGAASGGRENIAVMKGIWMMGAFIMTPGVYTFTGNGSEMGNRMPMWQNGMGMGMGMGMAMMVIPHVDQLLLAGRMNGAQVGITTNATGLGSFLLNATQDTVCYEINVNGLSGPITAIHLHNAAAGQNGPVVIPLTDGIDGNTVKGMIAGAALSDNLMSLLKGELYINLHTAANPGGEIRGQVMLETDMMFKGMLSDEAHVHTVNLTGKNPAGLISFSISQDKKIVKYLVVSDSLTGGLQAAKIMYGKPGMVGAMAYDETMNIMMGMPIVQGTIDVSMNPAFVDSLMAGAVYINLTTMMNPNGELRGQLSLDKNSLPLDIMLDSSQVMGNTVVGANAMGLGLASLNYSFDTLKYDVIIKGLSGEMTNVMLLDASDMMNMVAIMNITANANGNRVRGMITGAGLTDDVISLALKGEICFRIATSMNPMGELAGHVTKFARDGFVYSMDGSQVAPNPTASVASAHGIIALNRTWTDAHYMLNANGLGSGFASAKFRLGAMTETGMMEKDISNNTSTNGNGLFAGGFWKSTDMTLPFMPIIGTHLIKDSIYIEINTMMQAAGEIRGQTKFTLNCAPISTGIEDALSHPDNISVFPNPTIGNTKVNVNFATAEKVTIQIHNAVGQLIFNEEKNSVLGENSFQYNLTGMPNGIYYVNVNTENESVTTKLILLK